MKNSFGLVALLVALASAGSALAQVNWPGDQAPHAILPVRDEVQNRELLASAAERLEKVSNALAGYQEALEGGEEAIKKIKPLDVGKTFVDNSQLGRFAKLLALVGEPAGPELSLRHQNFYQQLADLRSRLKQLPAVQKALPKALEQLKQRAKRGLNGLKTVDALIREKKWDEAANRLFELRDNLDELGFWFEGAQVAADYEPYDQRMQAIQPNWWQWWREQNNARIDQQREAQATNFAALLTEVEEAASGLAANGKAVVANQQLAGPDLVTHFIGRWQQVQLAALRSRALEWSRDGDQEGWDRTRVTELEKEQLQFSTNMPKALAKLIEADAARASAGEVADLYARYLAACAPLAGLVPDEAMFQVLAPALDKLAARDPAFQHQVTAYRAATADVLRWRERAVAAAVKAQRTQFPALEAFFAQAFAKDTQHAGLVSVQDAHNGPRFLDPIPLVVEDGSTRFLNQKVMAASLAPLPGKQGHVVSRYTNRCYAILPLQANLSAEVAALRKDLLADQHPPLTLEASAALYSAEQGQFASAGGVVTSYELPAMITRYLLASEADVPLFGLGKIPGEPIAQRFQQAMLACRLEPMWLAHRYFYVSINK
jgi:hypothetical protein